MTKKVLACIDASPYAEAVCDYAVWAAKKLDVAMSVVHVLDKAQHTQTPDLSGSIGLGSQELLLQQLAELDEKHSKLAMERGRSILDAAKARAEQAGVKAVDERLRHGQLVETLTELEEETRLLVMGKRGFSSAEAHGHMGLHVERVIRSLHKPILLTQQSYKAPQRIMLAYDGSATALKGLEMLAGSPLGRGFLTGALQSTGTLANGDSTECCPSAVRVKGAKPISLCPMGPTWAPSRRAINCAPRQIPSTGRPDAKRCAMSCSSPCRNG